MGYRVTQTIHSCSICDKSPEDGEYLWHMGNEIWCQECCDKIDEGDDEERPE